MSNRVWEQSKERLLARVRHRPEESVLYRVVYQFHEELGWVWEERYQSQYGCLRDEVVEAFRKYLDCGILLHGCARAVCESCNHSELIAFSCKRRNLCGSCDAKRALLFAENLHENVLLPELHSHQVYTIPKRLRSYFKYDRSLLKYLYHAAGNAWKDCVHDAFPDMQTGAVMSLHSAGDLLHFHPHVHSLSLHGATDHLGNFHELDSVDTEYLTRVFADYVYEALLAQGLIDKDTVYSMKDWEHSGFNVFVGEPVAGEDADARLFLARYLKKSAISLSRLELVESEDNELVRLNKVSDDEVVSRDLSPLDFLAELQASIPDRWEQTSRYLGCYSSRARGKKRLALDTPGPLPELEPPGRPSAEWARCMKKVFELNPLECKRCGGKMKIIAFVHAGSEIKKICKSLKINPWRAPPPLKCCSLNLAA